MIPVCTPLLGKNEAKYLLDCVEQNWISSSGKYIGIFEEQFSRYCGCQYGIAVTNGTAALHLGLVALGIQPGDEIIMPTFAIASTAFSAIYCGAKPIFVDSETDTWNIDAEKIEEKITKKTKAIMPVHTYGHPCEMKKILAVARKHRLSVIEDAAEAHGAEYSEKKVGGLGDLGCFSFYGNKIITTGEGGMVVTNNKVLAARCKRLKNLSFLENRRFWHEEVGFNYRMTNVQAALGVAQFERIGEMVELRRQNALAYYSRLKDIRGLVLPVERKNTKNVYWMYGILVTGKFGMSREVLMAKLREKGIETRTFFWPLHDQPILKKMKLTTKERFPVAERIACEGMYLPSGSGLKKSEIDFICEAIKAIQKNTE